MKYQSIITYSMVLVSFSMLNMNAFASGTMTEDEISNVSRQAVKTESEQQQIQQAAGLLAEYEIEARKLLEALDANSDAHNLSRRSKSLMEKSEAVITSAKFRLPQCKDYLEQTMVLQNRLTDISHQVLERDYHLDGALPEAGEECYHTKDLYVHPATVIVLTRDDPELEIKTKKQIKAEITEVLVHTELVRQLVLY